MGPLKESIIAPMSFGWILSSITTWILRITTDLRQLWNSCGENEKHISSNYPCS
jgi:hypothetical protein